MKFTMNANIANWRTVHEMHVSAFLESYNRHNWDIHKNKHIFPSMTSEFRADIHHTIQKKIHVNQYSIRDDPNIIHQMNMLLDMVPVGQVENLVLLATKWYNEISPLNKGIIAYALKKKTLEKLDTWKLLSQKSFPNHMRATFKKIYFNASNEIKSIIY